MQCGELIEETAQGPYIRLLVITDKGAGRIAASRLSISSLGCMFVCACVSQSKWQKGGQSRKKKVGRCVCVCVCVCVFVCES